MFQSIQYPIVRSSDRTIHEAVRKLSEDTGVGVGSVGVTLVLKHQPNRQQSHYEPVKFDVANPFVPSPPDPKGERLKTVIDLDGPNIRGAEYKFNNGAKIGLNRTHDENGLVNQADTLTLHLEITDESMAFRLQGLVNKHFPVIRAYDLPQAVGHDLSHYLHARETSIQRLEDKLGEITSKLTEYSIGLDARYQEKLTALEQEYESKRAALEAERAASRDWLDAQRQELEKRSAELDDRENVHARRQLYKDLKAIIQKRTAKFELTAQTKDLRWHVWIISGGFAVLLLAGFGFCFYTNLTSPATNWVAVGSQIGFGVGLAGMVTFLIRWQNRWFLSHAEEEFRLQRMDLDMDRASWLVELVMEWKQESPGEPFPAELLAKLAQGLFGDPDRGVVEMHPAETLASGLLADDGELSVEPGKVLLRRKVK